MYNKTVLNLYINYMDKTISSFQEQNEEQQNKTVYEHKIYDEDYGWMTQSDIVKELNRLSKEGWSIVSSNIYTANCISIILERLIKT